MQLVSSRIWTRVAVSISYNDNYYTMGTSKEKNLIQAVGIYSEDIEKEFGIEKYAMLIMKSGKQMTEGTELPNQEKITTPLNIQRWKKKLKKEYLRRTRKLLKTKLPCGNLIKRLNN